MSTDVAPPFELSAEDRVTLEAQIREGLKAAGLDPQYPSSTFVLINMNIVLRSLLGVILSREHFDLWASDKARRLRLGLWLCVGEPYEVNLSQYREGREIFEVVASVIQTYGEELLPRDTLRRLEELRMWL